MFDNFRKPSPKPSIDPMPVTKPTYNEDIWGPAPTDPEQEPNVTGGEFFPQPIGGSSDVSTTATSELNNAPTHNVLNRDVTVEGTLRFTDDLLVDGQVVGEITSDGTLTVGENAVISAAEGSKVAIKTGSAIIQGKVTGDVVVSDRVELASTAQLVGDVTAARIAIHEGAIFVGHCMVGASAVVQATATPAPKRAKSKGGSATNLLS